MKYFEVDGKLRLGFRAEDGDLQAEVAARAALKGRLA